MKKKQRKTTKQANQRPSYSRVNDHGTAERLLRGEVIVENNLARVKRQHPLAYYLNRDDISPEQCYWGQRLVKDYEASHPGRSSAAMLLRVDGICTIHMPINKLTALDRWNKTLSRLNDVSRVIVEYVLVQGFYLSDIHPHMGWSKRNSGLDRLCEVLDEVEKSYREFMDMERDRRKQEEELV